MPKIFYSEKGQGLPVILIHGFCETHSIWDNLRNELSTSYRVISPDLPGFGQSALPGNLEFSIDDIAGALAKWLSEKNIDKCVMIGHSLGGYITLAFAHRYASRLVGFGLFHSTSYADDQEKRSTRNKVVKYIQKHGAQDFTSTFIPGLFYNKNSEVKLEIETLVKDASSCTTEALVAYTKAMRDRQDRSQELEKSRMPILFIAGEKDTAVPLELSKKQTAKIDPRFVFFLPETGHMGMFERKAETTKMVSAFLSQF